MERIFFLAIQFICLAGFSQSILTGMVIDKKTNEPMPFVDIYLASTSMGTATGKEGAFRFKVENKGKYDLVASFVGYTTVRIPVLIKSDTTFFFDIKLIQKSSELPSIVVRADTSNRKKDYADFKRFFLGEAINASSCHIKNPKDVYVYADKSENVLVAFAKAPIVIENEALGYRIYYDLEKFEFNYETEIINIKGIPRFEELTSEGEHRNEHWSKVRKKSYAGSLRHLMYSILNNRLPQEGWHVVIEYPLTRKPEEFIANKIRFHRNLHNWDSVNYYREMRQGPPHSPPLQGKELLSENDKHLLLFKGIILVEFKKGRDERFALPKNPYSIPFQKSIVKFLDQPLKIYDNGFYEPQQNVYIEGYFAWISRIANLLPYDF